MMDLLDCEKLEPAVFGIPRELAVGTDQRHIPLDGGSNDDTVERVGMLPFYSRLNGSGTNSLKPRSFRNLMGWRPP